MNIEKKICIIGVTLAIVCALGLVKIGIASDGTNCESTLGTFGSFGSYQSGCYSQQIYKQNQVLIQENKQLIKLQAWNFCKPYSDMTFYDIQMNQMVSGDVGVCIHEVLEKTK